MTAHDPVTLRPWLPTTPALRLLEIGCGAAEDAGEWLAGGVGEYVGVDLDETAVAQARSQWPSLTFLCADAAGLAGEYRGSFDVVLIRRPDLFVRPGNWQQVFAALPRLLRSGERVLVMLMGRGETVVARRWLEESGLSVMEEVRLPGSEADYLLVAVNIGCTSAF